MASSLCRSLSGGVRRALGPVGIRTARQNSSGRMSGAAGVKRERGAVAAAAGKSFFDFEAVSLGSGTRDAPVEGCARRPPARARHANGSARACSRAISGSLTRRATRRDARRDAPPARP